MFGIKCIVSLVILNIVGLAVGLFTLPKVEENDIAKTEVAIRATANAIFSSLKLRNIRNNSRIQQFSLIHNYFVSLTLQDYNSLKEIAKLTRVNKGVIQNITTDFITTINDILDEENGEHETNEIEHHLMDEIKKIEDLRIMSESQYNKSTKLNKDVLDILQNDKSLDLNTTIKPIYRNYDDLLDDIPIWHEETFFGRRIFNGKKTKIQDFPFMASVQIFNKFQCGGCIIKSDLVITAAACLQLAWNNRFFRENPPFLSVRVGSSYYEIGGENIGIQEIYFHPGYNPKNLHDNLALMRLQRVIKFSNKKVKKIMIDAEDHKLPYNTGKITIIGWGATSASNQLHGPLNDRLKYATLPIYPHSECREIYSGEFVKKENFCAGYISSGTAACNRDLGGPGIKSDFLIGIISFGTPKCGAPDSPTVFTKLGYYYDWIEEIMEQRVPHTNKKTTLMPLTLSYTLDYSKATSWTHLPISASKSRNEITMATENVLREKNKEQKNFKQYLNTVFQNTEKKEYDHYQTRQDNSTKLYFGSDAPVDLKTKIQYHSSPIFSNIPITSKSLINHSLYPEKKPFGNNTFNQIKGQFYDNIANLIDENYYFKYLNDQKNLSSTIQPVTQKYLSTVPMNLGTLISKLNTKENKKEDLKVKASNKIKEPLFESVIVNTSHLQQENKSAIKKDNTANKDISKFTRIFQNPSTVAVHKNESLPIEKIQEQINELVKASAQESKNRIKELRDSAMEILHYTDNNPKAVNDTSAELESRIILELTNRKLKDKEKYDHISQLIDIASLLDYPLTMDSYEDPGNHEFEYNNLSILSTNEVDEDEESNY